MDDHERIIGALEALDPSCLSYDDWIHVGMALKSEGFPCSVWDEWSMRDSAKYEAGVCEEKWNTFNGEGWGMKTIFYLAENNSSWKPYKVYSFDDYVPANVTGNTYYEEEISKGAKTEEPYQMAIRYLESLFRSDETVSYVHSAIYKEDRNKWVPANAGTVRKVSALIRDLKKYKNIEDAFGTMKPEAGAWIRHNPASGPNDDDVTRYEHVLVESDSLPVEEQKKLLINLKLPIAALIESGGKSVHAIVKIQAIDKSEYKKRVDYLFDYLSKHKFVVDKANKNPARLSRLPGAMRDGKLQKLLAINIGCSSWEEWIDYTNGINDNLPPIHSARSIINQPVETPPTIIEGILRKGAKMIVTGDSKSGKTCLLMNLAICIAEGWKWLGHQCERGKVLYINMEVMQSDFETRYLSIYKAYNEPITEDGADNFDWWNLRGKAEPLEKLAPMIIRRCRNHGYLAIIIDPIYKVQGGDENSAEAIGKFCALFDKIAEETGASMIYVHHHAKGAQGARKTMDRGAGSGVFARDADAIVDFSGLVLDPNTKELLRALNEDLHNEPIPLQMEMVLRSFRSPDPARMFFDFPLHTLDHTNILDGAAVEGTPEAGRLMAPNNQRTDAEKKAIVDEAFDSAVKADGTAKFSDMYNSSVCKVKKDALAKYISLFPDDYVREGSIVRKL